MEMTALNKNLMVNRVPRVFAIRVDISNKRGGFMAPPAHVGSVCRVRVEVAYAAVAPPADPPAPAAPGPLNSEL